MEKNLLGYRELYEAIIMQAYLDKDKKKYKKEVEEFFKSELYETMKLFLKRNDE